MYEYFANTRSNLGYFDFYTYMNDLEYATPERDYKVLTTDTWLPVSAANVQEHLKLDPSQSESDTYISLLISSATALAENAMRREIIKKQFQTYFNLFVNGMQLRKSPLLTFDELALVQSDGSWQTVDPASYYVSDSNNYSRIYAQPQIPWPTLMGNHYQNVRAKFSCGYLNADAVPHDIKLAIMHHVNVLYEQRGDWGSADFNLSMLIGEMPALSRATYNKYRILNR